MVLEIIRSRDFSYDITFHVRTPTGTKGLTGSDLILSLKGATEGGPEMKEVLQCTVMAVTLTPGSQRR
jgi:hypothetical protein